ncbi:MAG: hypothetical protein JWL77_1405 [Chthonomonadaceae bacterium]|nr:hypothetical protein [Chthonomonadaceae bacterium]
MLPCFVLGNAGPAHDQTAQESDIVVKETGDHIAITTSAVQARLRKQGYVSGVEGGSFVDKKTGFHDLGFGLDIVDWLMEPGSDAAYRSQLPPDLVYEFNNPLHGKEPKRSVEGPQICTKAKELPLETVQGKDFVAVKTHFRYTLAAPGKKTGSEWQQTIVFPQGKRYFLSYDTVKSVNVSDALFLRLDMPGHIRHNQGDTFSEVYLSYLGSLPSRAFRYDFAPDEAYGYHREKGKIPQRFIRAYHLRDPKTGASGSWLAGMTLDPSVVSEAWCHQRGYVCMIEEFGGHPIKPGQSFGAAFLVGFFDSIEEMNAVYDQYAGTTALEVTDKGWKPIRKPARR